MSQARDKLVRRKAWIGLILLGLVLLFGKRIR